MAFRGVIDEWEMREQMLWGLFFQGLCSCLVVKRWRERLNKPEGRLDRRKAGGFQDERELSMLAGGQGVNEAKDTPRGSSIKPSLGEVVEVGIRNSGRGYLGKSSLGKFRSEKEGR